MNVRIDQLGSSNLGADGISSVEKNFDHSVGISLSDVMKWNTTAEVASAPSLSDIKNWNLADLASADVASKLKAFLDSIYSAPVSNPVVGINTLPPITTPVLGSVTYYSFDLAKAMLSFSHGGIQSVDQVPIPTGVNPSAEVDPPPTRTVYTMKDGTMFTIDSAISNGRTQYFINPYTAGIMIDAPAATPLTIGPGGVISHAPLGAVAVIPEVPALDTDKSSDFDKAFRLI